jgi:tetratricopeptide (TPR) repeat protein
MALVGQPPFVGGTMAKDKAKGPPPWPLSDTPARVVAAIERGLAAEPADRWPSMDALLGALSEPAPARGRGRIVVGGTVLAAVGVVVSSGVGVASQPCQDFEEALGDAWTPARRADVKQAFGSIGASFAETAAVNTLAELDGYAKRWVELRTDACEATAVRQEQSPEELELSIACFERARLSLAAATSQLARANVETVRRAHVVTASLPPLVDCRDAEALRSSVPPPRGEDATRVDSIQQLLAEARAANHAAQYEEAMERISQARDALAEVSYQPIRAEVAFLEGDVLDSRGDYETSTQRLRDALLLATQWWQPAVAQSASTKLMFVLGFRQLRFDEALDFATLARGLAVGNPRAEAAALANVATVLDSRGDFGEALRMHRDALARREATLGPVHSETAASEHSLGNVHLALGDPVKAEARFRGSLARWQKALGPEHPHVAIATYSLASAIHDQGRLAEAEALYHQALEIREAAMGPEHPDVAQTLNGLANSLLDQGRYEEAAEAARPSTSPRQRWARIIPPPRPRR